MITIWCERGHVGCFVQDVDGYYTCHCGFRLVNLPVNLPTVIEDQKDRVKALTFRIEEYEDEFRDKMKKAGLPVEKE